MAGIAGFYTLNNIAAEQDAGRATLRRAADALRHRGPEGSGAYLDGPAGLAQIGRDIIRSGDGKSVLVLDGTLHNTTPERLLAGLINEGADALREANGVFALAFWDGKRLLLARDRLGVKPLCYAREGGRCFFGSEPKALFAMGFAPALDDDSLRELFALGPAHTPGCGVFKGLRELLPAQWISLTPDGPREGFYWRLESRPHPHDEEETVGTTSALVRDAIETQTDVGAPICSFLSGGLDSSLVSAISSHMLKNHGLPLPTYSFDFAGNDDHYRANAFQPSRDAPYAAGMAAFLQTEHTALTCDALALADLLEPAMRARDLPGMADVDASLLYFCGIVGKRHTIALTGEAADEVFGGYKWFHSEAAFTQREFPWSDMRARRSFLREDVLERLDLDAYARSAYEDSVAQTPRCPGDTPEEARRREIAWLNLRWFMQTLLEPTEPKSTTKHVWDFLLPPAI